MLLDRKDLQEMIAGSSSILNLSLIVYDKGFNQAIIMMVRRQNIFSYLSHNYFQYHLTQSKQLKMILRSIRVRILKEKMHTFKSAMRFGHISEGGINAIISSKWINIITNQGFNKKNCNREKSIRDIILEVQPEEILEDFQRKKQKESSRLNEKIYYKLDIKQQKFKKSFEQLRSLFLGKYQINQIIFHQARINQAQVDMIDNTLEEEGEEIREEEEEIRKQIKFFPTRFSTSLMFQLILKRKKKKILLMGTSGTGKTVSIALLTILSNYINSYRFTDDYWKEKQFLLGSSLILDIPKTLYFSLRDHDNFSTDLKQQCPEIDFQKYTGEDNFQQLFNFVSKEYKGKNKFMPKDYRVKNNFLIFEDQINSLLSSFRKHSMSKKYLLNKQKDQQVQKNQAFQYWKQYFKLLVPHNIIKRMSNRFVYLASNNIQKDIILEEKECLNFNNHQGIHIQETNYSNFDYNIQKQLGHYFMFELYQRGYLSELEFSAMKISQEKTNEKGGSKSLYLELIQYWCDLKLLSIKSTPKIICKFLQYSNETILLKRKQKDMQSIKLQELKKYIQKLMQKFYDNNQQDLRSQMNKYLSKGLPFDNFRRTLIFHDYLKIAKSIKDLQKQQKIQKIKQSNKDQIRNQIKKLTEKFYQKRVVQNVKQKSSEQYIEKEKHFQKDLFQFNLSENGDAVQFQTNPTVQPKDFYDYLAEPYQKNAQKNFIEYSRLNFTNCTGYIANKVRSRYGGFLYQNLFIEALKICQQKKVEFVMKKSSFNLVFVEDFGQFSKKNVTEAFSFEKNFQKLFQIVDISNLKNQSILLTPKNYTKGVYSTNNPSVDLVIAQCKMQNGSKHIKIHTIDTTIGFPTEELYFSKAKKFTKRFEQFQEIYVSNSSKKTKKEKVISKNYNISYQIHHHIIGLNQPYSQNVDISRLNGVLSVNTLHCREISFVQGKQNHHEIIKIFNEVNKDLQSKYNQKEHSSWD